jgi:hypothetical protein
MLSHSHISLCCVVFPDLVLRFKICLPKRWQRSDQSEGQWNYSAEIEYIHKRYREENLCELNMNLYI